MADKETGDGGKNYKFLNRIVSFGAPYAERFVREKLAPYVVNSKMFSHILTQFSEENLAAIGAGMPGGVSLLVNEIPDWVFLSREIGDTARNLATVFFTEVAKRLDGDINPTPEKMKEVEGHALKAVEDFLDQEVFYDRTGYFHYAACPNWQGGRQPPKAKLRDALELGRQPGTCCYRKVQQDTKAPAAEPAKAAEAPKSKPGFTKLPEGASVMDVLGALLRDPDAATQEVGKRLIAWMQSLSKKKFMEVEALMQESFDTLEEAFALDQAEGTKAKIRILQTMKSRKEEKKSKIAQARIELEAKAKKAFEAAKKALHSLDESLVSDASLVKQQARITELRNKQEARKTAAEPSFRNLWGWL